jgi:hypothetical protein
MSQLFCNSDSPICVRVNFVSPTEQKHLQRANLGISGPNQQFRMVKNCEDRKKTKGASNATERKTVTDLGWPNIDWDEMIRLISLTHFLGLN